ncbi:MAG TPA: VCBS repeat-containing protein [Puia sp.]|nr:VCBS repeat-containing protein [Puia sp.]
MIQEKKLTLIFFLTVAIVACTSTNKKNALRFSFLSSSETGVNFQNTITENDSLNMFVNEYTYMGGGVGVGDFNNDGLEDIFFSGNQVSSRLYINKGNFRFEDITENAGVSTTSWCTGVSIVDINNDGWPDIYVCVSGRVTAERRRNLLFINQHDLTFKEEAKEYGLDDTSFSTQAVFFDYDKDGWLDMYLLNHNLNDDRPNDIRYNKTDSNSQAADKLFHNQGIPAGMNHPVFKNVSRQAGIIEDGNGLGVAVSDFNGDGYPDIYVANDYIKNDLLWLNNKNGTFSNCIASAVKHQSYSSMGTDAADFNNDGLVDIATLDMQPETNERKKMMYSFMNEQRRQAEKQNGYQPEFIHNMLQLNNGARKLNNRTEPFFSEIGQMAGVSETDWSWSVLFADFDNDGWKDMHIANGLGRDPTNTDFLEYRHQTVIESGASEKDISLQRALNEHLASLGEVKLRNYLFRNNGNLTFSNVSDVAGIGENSISNGVAYADFDNDGDLDLVTNNINGYAFVMRNEINHTNDSENTNNYLTIKLNGGSLNRDGIGAVIYAYSNDFKQMVEQYPVRGYLSSVDNRLHIGCGRNNIDSLKIIWPDGKMQLILQPVLNKTLAVNYSNAVEEYDGHNFLSNSLFTDITDKAKADFRHKETFFFDYSFQPLIPQQFSQEGPFISIGDINADGLQDFFVGGAFKQPGKIFLQKPDGSFENHELVNGQKNEEDMQSIFFDADGDGDLDLLIVGGSTEFDLHSGYYRPRLYLNEGNGNFKPDLTAFPADIMTPAKAVASGDFDGDGYTDVFIGGRIQLGKYPEPPRSFLLKNNHGKFTDVTEEVCKELMHPGLINAAIWADIDNDKKPELIIAGEWMGIRVFKNIKNQLVEITDGCNLKGIAGMWRSIAVADIDGDGDMDIVAGNLGLNNPYHISAQQPAEMVAKDFDNNGIIDPVFCYYIKNENGKYELYPSISRDQFAMQVPSIKKRFELNEEYAKASMDEIFSKEDLNGADILQCNETRSGYFENNGKGKFSFHPFGMQAQMAPVNAIIVDDVDGDGKKDILIAGNEYQYNITVGSMDASYGLLLKGDGKGNFAAMTAQQSGLIVDGDVRDMKLISIKKSGKAVLVARNDDKLQLLLAQPMK